jgi:hypothetical protein
MIVPTSAKVGIARFYNTNRQVGAATPPDLRIRAGFFHALSPAYRATENLAPGDGRKKTLRFWPKFDTPFGSAV